MFKLICLLIFFLNEVIAGEGLCLALVVKNDEEAIEACLASVKDQIDCVVVCDAGSTDTTLERIKYFAEKEEIFVQIFKHPWKSFAHNKKLAVERAQKVLEQRGSSLETSYILVMDADTILQGELKTTGLDGYLIAEQSAALCSFRYTPHLVLASRRWESSGFAGEYWTAQGPAKMQKMDGVLLIGQGKGESFEAKKDLPLLRHLHESDPYNKDLLFYLAQSERCQHHYDEAISFYKKRLEQGGDAEEIWFSKYMLGKCFEELGQWEPALFWYLEAYQENASRTESLVKVATYFRLRGKNHLAYLFAKHGTLVPKAADQLLFDLVPETDYHFDEELSIASYYTRFREEGYMAISNLVMRKNLPWSVRQQGYQNLLFYAQNLECRTRFAIDIELPPIQEGSDERYHHSNPSVMRVEDGYLVICRAVNYTQVGARDFFTNDDRGIIRTKNFLLHYDNEFRLLSQQEIFDDPHRPRIRSCNVEGLEDCRLVGAEGKVWFTCTTSDTNPTGQRQISLCELEGAKVKKLTPLIGPDLHRCEKNWLPFAMGGQIHVVYSYEPFIVYRPDLMTGECAKVASVGGGLDFSHFRGSAGPIEIEGGYLVLAHEVLQQADFQRVYFHRFLLCDKEFHVKKVSKPFTFSHFGVEFCCGMTLNQTGAELILSVGIEDSEAYLYFTPLQTVYDLLYPLP
jgi:glycosyltransferase involved in cell wall biosynthesis